MGWLYIAYNESKECVNKIFLFRFHASIFQTYTELDMQVLTKCNLDFPSRLPPPKKKIAKSY